MLLTNTSRKKRSPLYGGEDIDTDMNEEGDEEEILFSIRWFQVISEEDYIHKKPKEKSNAFVKLENDPRITKIGRFYPQNTVSTSYRSFLIS